MRETSQMQKSIYYTISFIQVQSRVKVICAFKRIRIIAVLGGRRGATESNIKKSFHKVKKEKEIEKDDLNSTTRG